MCDRSKTFFREDSVGIRSITPLSKNNIKNGESFEILKHFFHFQYTSESKNEKLLFAKFLALYLNARK